MEIDINIRENIITGIITDTKEEVIESIKNKSIQKIGIVKEDYLNTNFLIRVYEWMYYEIRRKRLILKNPKKKIDDSLRIVGLDNTYLNRNINSLSSSEKILVILAISLLSNPDIIILDDLFKYLDKEKEKSLIMLLEKIRDNYNKTIILINDDSEILYKYTKRLIIKKNNLFIEDDTNKLFQRVDFLHKNNIKVPEIIELTHLIKKKKKVKLEYHKDVRDILKDIYKHV
jgi:energy-coupling factor transport system ATP-binding protein